MLRQLCWQLGHVLCSGMQDRTMLAQTTRCVGGAIETYLMVKGTRPGGYYITRVILDGPDDVQLFDIMNHVLLEGDQLQSALEVFKKTCRLHRAFSDEDVSGNLKVAVAHEKELA